jgi:hypothetical protein
MPLDDREAIVAAVEETYALMGAALATDIPSQVIESAVRPEILQRIAEAGADPYVTDEEMLGLLREAYFELVQNVLRVHDELLGPDGGDYEEYLAQRGLTGSGRTVKVNGFRRALAGWLQRVPGVHRIKKAFEWGNIILGSLGGVPIVGVVSDPIRELKEAIEAQGDDDNAH